MIDLSLYSFGDDGETLARWQLEAAALRTWAKDGGLCPLCNGENDGVLRIKSDGMGVESVAMLLEWLRNPASRDFCLCQLIIITAQTGDEHDDTKQLMEQYILPLYRFFALRFVELARAGELEEAGIVILQDTREPYVLHTEGFYKLSDHLKRAGTVPQFGGEHRCAIKFKSFVCEYWLTHCLRLHGVYHIFGYNADEQGRAERCDTSIEKRNEQVQVAFGFNSEEGERAARSDAAYTRRNSKKGEKAKEDKKARLLIREEISGETKFIAVYVPFRFKSDVASAEVTHMAFGYNATEGKRAVRTTSHDTLIRVGFYPLLLWGWTRLQCLLFIFEILGVWWPKSACLYCPFNSEASKESEAGIARLKAHPAKNADALLVEYGSLCLNERGALYNTKTLQSIVINNDLLEAYQIFEAMLDRMEFGLYEVKRVYSAPGVAARSVIRIAKGTRAEIAKEFARQTKRLKLKVRTERGINYGFFAERRAEYPAIEGFLVAAPAHIETKVRSDRFDLFEERYAKAAQGLGIRLPQLPGATLINLQREQPTLFFEEEIAA